MNKKKCLGLSQTLYSNSRYFILHLQRHISKSKCYAIAIELEKSKEDCDVELTDITQDRPDQIKADQNRYISTFFFKRSIYSNVDHCM